MKYIKIIFLKLIDIYQGYSKFRPSNCRYYPSCSEYSRWQFENRNIFFAFYYSIIRILSCNQLFPGGIQYPTIKKKFINKQNLKFKNINKNIKIKYWYVPKIENNQTESNQNIFYIIKVVEFKK